MSQTEDCSPGDRLSDNSEEPLQRSMVFSTVLCLVRTKNIRQFRDTFLRVHSESVWPWHLGRES